MQLTRIDLKLGMKNEKEFSYQKASLMHGILMEWLDTDYAGKLHRNNWNPYAQHIEKKNGEWHWIVNVFDEEACQKICPVLLNPEQDKMTLKHHNQEIEILERKAETISSEELMNQYCFKDAAKTIRIQIKTPMAFKQKGAYLFYPDIRCMLQSMIHKYEAVTSGEEEIDEQILDEMVRNVRIQKYHLKSCSFHMEGIRIPAFIGEVQFGLRGSQTLINYIHFLFHFACYSGIGIKTAMGMGAIEVQEKDL